MIHSLIQPTLLLVWHVHMHNSLTHRSHSPSSPQEGFLLKNTLSSEKFLHFIRVISSPFLHNTTQHNTTTSPKIERKRKKKPLWHAESLIQLNCTLTWCHAAFKVHLNNFHTFYLQKYQTEKNVIKCPSNKNIKLLLQGHKNCPEMKASFLFNILGTISDNLSALD